MSESSKKGSDFEKKVAALLRKADQSGTRNKGSHANWHRRSDVFTSLGMHIECKDHKTVKVKEWFDQADTARSANEVPVVVFSKDGEPMSMMRFKDVLDLYIEIADLHDTINDLKAPVPAPATVGDFEQRKLDAGCMMCAAGHIADEAGKCLQRDCKYSRYYKKPKAKKGKK